MSKSQSLLAVDEADGNGRTPSPSFPTAPKYRLHLCQRSLKQIIYLNLLGPDLHILKIERISLNF